MSKMPATMSAADLRALYQPAHRVLVDADADRIYTLIISAASQGKIYMDFEVLISRAHSVINKLRSTFPDVDFIELETLTFRRLYRAIWALSQPCSPPPLPQLR
jgi:hypothetical protein